MGSTRGGTRRPPAAANVGFVLSMFGNKRVVIVGDVVATAVLLGVVGYAALDSATPDRVTEPAWVSLLATVLIAGPAALRRIWPLAAFWISMGATTAAMASGVVPVVA